MKGKCHNPRTIFNSSFFPIVFSSFFYGKSRSGPSTHLFAPKPVHRLSPIPFTSLPRVKE